jgi:hypothetical protein
MMGAMIERGRIIEAKDGIARVESMTRPGLVIPALPLPSGLEDAAPGTPVFYFCFADGTGLVLSRIEVS